MRWRSAFILYNLPASGEARACRLQVVNLIKVQILLNDVERVMPDASSLSPARRDLGRRRALAALQ